jgi:hypothetical protein
MCRLWRKRSVYPEVVIDPKIPSYKEIDRNLTSIATIWHLSKRPGAGCLLIAIKRFRRRSGRPSSIRLPKKSRLRRSNDSFRKPTGSPPTHDCRVSPDMLRHNRQLVIEGGPGSGKTWLALEQAFRFAGVGFAGGDHDRCGKL